jgi:hypothetical protein
MYTSKVINVTSYTVTGSDYGSQASNVGSRLVSDNIVISSAYAITLIKELDISMEGLTSDGNAQTITLYDGWQGSYGQYYSSKNAVAIWSVTLVSSVTAAGGTTAPHYTVGGPYSKRFGDGDQALVAKRGLFINRSNSSGAVKCSIQYK